MITWTPTWKDFALLLPNFSRSFPEILFSIGSILLPY